MCFLSWRKLNLKTIFQKKIKISKKHILIFFQLKCHLKSIFEKSILNDISIEKKSPKNRFFRKISDFFSEKKSEKNRKWFSPRRKNIFHSGFFFCLRIVFYYPVEKESTTCNEIITKISQGQKTLTRFEGI